MIKRDASAVHTFKEVTFEKEHVPRSINKSTQGVDHLFHSQLQHSSLRLDNTCTGGQPPPWYCLGANMWHATAAELQLAVCLQEVGYEHRASKGWGCGLLNHCQLLLMHPHFTNHKWCFSRGAMCNAIGWAGSPSRTQGRQPEYNELDPGAAVDDVIWLPVTDPKACVEVQCRMHG